MTAHLVDTDRAWWWLYAQCRGEDPDIFFPDAGASPVTARAICRECSVRRECFVAHIEEHHGIWAGTTLRERARARKRIREGSTIDAEYVRMLAVGL